jgi:hypothetical protein
MAIRYWNSDEVLTWANTLQQWVSRTYTFEAKPLGSTTEGANGGTGNTADFEVPSRYDDLLLYLNVTAQSGTSPTLDVDYQTSPDNGATWYTHTSFTQVGAATGTEVLKIDNPGHYYRFFWTIGGSSTPTYTFSIEVEGKRHGGRF